MKKQRFAAVLILLSLLSGMALTAATSSYENDKQPKSAANLETQIDPSI